MLYGGGLLGVVMLAFWAWAVLDVVATPGSATRRLPKLAWLAIVVLFWVLGALAWVALGRPQGAPVGGGRRAGTGRRWGHPSDSRDDAAALSDRERLELERREYYRRMDEELDRRLEEKQRRREGPDQPRG